MESGIVYKNNITAARYFKLKGSGEKIKVYSSYAGRVITPISGSG